MRGALAILFLMLWTLWLVDTAENGFTDTEVVTVGSALAFELSRDYLGATPPRALVRLADEQGWVACAQDLIDNRKVVATIVTHVPSRVPGLMFLMMVLVLADGLLGGRICGGEETECYKYPIHPLLTQWKFV